MTAQRPWRGLPRLVGDAVHVWALAQPCEGDPVTRVLSRYRGRGERLPVVARGGGKPSLGGWGGDLRFNVARTRGLVLVAVARGREVGVDVERLGRGSWLSLPSQVLTPRELASLDGLPGVAPADAFLRIWARKEAVLKAAGVGLAVDPVLVEVSGAGEPAEVVGLPSSIGPTARYGLVDLSLPGCAAALAVERPHGSVTVLTTVSGCRRFLTKSLPVLDLGLTARL